MRGSQAQASRLPASTRATTPGGSPRQPLVSSSRAGNASSLSAVRRPSATTSSASSRVLEKLELVETLRKCLDETQRIAAFNSQLSASLQTSQLEIATLKEQLAKQNEELQRKTDVEFSNLRLQAQILALERERIPLPRSSSPSGGAANADLIEANEDLKKQYALLEGYYTELLAYVKGNGSNEGTNQTLE